MLRTVEFTEKDEEEVTRDVSEVRICFIQLFENEFSDEQGYAKGGSPLVAVIGTGHQLILGKGRILGILREYLSLFLHELTYLFDSIVADGLRVEDLLVNNGK